MRLTDDQIKAVVRLACSADFDVLLLVLQEVRDTAVKAMAECHEPYQVHRAQGEYGLSDQLVQLFDKAVKQAEARGGR